MKKRNYILFLSSFLAFGALTACGNESKPDNRPEATIEIVHDDTVIKYKSTLNPKKSHKEGDKGQITFTLKENYFPKDLRQNDLRNCVKDPNDKFTYNIELYEGLNTFKLTTYAFENIESENGMLEGPNTHIDINGTITDDVDDRPSQGGMPVKPMPSYKNGKDIYFIDQGWWSEAAASTNIICFDKDKNIVNTEDLSVGTMMKHLKYYKSCNQNTWKWVIDLDNTSYVQFVRTGEGGYADWGARTDLLKVNDLDTYMINTTKSWYGDGNFAEGKWMNFKDFNPNDKPVNPNPDKPVEPVEGAIYVGVPNWWNKDNAATKVVTYVGESKAGEKIADFFKETPDNKIYSFKLDADVTAIQFERTDPSNTNNYWGAKSVKFNLSELGTNNILYIDSQEDWNNPVKLWPATL